MMWRQMIISQASVGTLMNKNHIFFIGRLCSQSLILTTFSCGRVQCFFSQSNRFQIVLSNFISRIVIS